MSRDILQSN